MQIIIFGYEMSHGGVRKVQKEISAKGAHKYVGEINSRGKFHQHAFTRTNALTLNFYFATNAMPNFTSTLNKKLGPTFIIFESKI